MPGLIRGHCSTILDAQLVGFTQLSTSSNRVSFQQCITLNGSLHFAHISEKKKNMSFPTAWAEEQCTPTKSIVIHGDGRVCGSTQKGTFP